MASNKMVKVKRQTAVKVQGNKYDRGKYETCIDVCGFSAIVFCLLLIIFGIAAFIIAANEEFKEQLPTWLGTLCIILVIGLVVCSIGCIGCQNYQSKTKENEYEIKDQFLIIPEEEVEKGDVRMEKYMDTIKF